jgi:hypothetical protein
MTVVSTRVRISSAFVLMVAFVTLLAESRWGAADREESRKEVRAGPVTIRVPVHFEVDERSTDSVMRRCFDDAVEVLADYGVYDSSAVFHPDRRAGNRKRWSEVIGGRKAELVSYEAGGTVYVAALWRSITPERHLFLSGRGPKGAPLLLQIIRSVKLPPVRAQGSPRNPRLKLWRSRPSGLLEGDWAQFTPGYDLLALRSRQLLLLFEAGGTWTAISTREDGEIVERVAGLPERVEGQARLTQTGAGPVAVVMDQPYSGVFSLRELRTGGGRITLKTRASGQEFRYRGEPGFFRNFGAAGERGAVWAAAVAGVENPDNAARHALQPVLHWFRCAPRTWSRVAVSAVPQRVPYHAEVSCAFTSRDELATAVGQSLAVLNCRNGAVRWHRVLEAGSRETIAALVRGDGAGQVYALATSNGALRVFSVSLARGGETRSSTLATVKLRSGSPADARLVRWREKLLMSWQTVQSVGKTPADVHDAYFPLYRCSGLRLALVDPSGAAGDGATLELP